MCMQVGAQNAGKSSLINAMRRAVGHKRPQEELTTAPLPGTTLGVFHLHKLMLLLFYSMDQQFCAPPPRPEAYPCCRDVHLLLVLRSSPRPLSARLEQCASAVRVVMWQE